MSWIVSAGCLAWRHWIIKLECLRHFQTGCLRLSWELKKIAFVVQHQRIQRQNASLHFVSVRSSNRCYCHRKRRDHKPVGRYAFDHIIVSCERKLKTSRFCFQLFNRLTMSVALPQGTEDAKARPSLAKQRVSLDTESIRVYVSSV